jgi:hypothetical protein
MGVPNSEVSYTSATTGRETTKSMTDMWWHWIKKNAIEQRDVRVKKKFKGNMNLTT